METFVTPTYGPPEGQFSPNGQAQPSQMPFRPHPYGLYAESPVNLQQGHYFTKDYADTMGGISARESEIQSHLATGQGEEFETEANMNARAKASQRIEIPQKFRFGLAKVNNRRTKMKQHKPSMSDPDDSSTSGNPVSPDGGPTGAWMGSQMPHGYLQQQVMPQTHPAMNHGFDFGAPDAATAGFDFGLDHGTGDAHPQDDILAAYDNGVGTAISPNQTDDTSSSWANDNFNHSMFQSLPAPSFAHQNSSNHSPQSSSGVPVYEIGYEQMSKGMDPASVQIYHEALAASNSSHEHTNSSSDAELSQYLTPPTEAHPLPWMNDASASRRTSDSSEFASTFTTNCHVQHQPIGLGMSHPTINPSNIFSASDAPPPPAMTPDVSPDQTAAIMSPKPYDLATRRKGQRPPPLMRPSASRSASHGGFPSISPQARAPAHTIRATQSHAVLNGRVSKPGSNHASPRNHHSHFEMRPHKEGHKASVSSANGLPVSGIDFGPFAQPSPVSSVHSGHHWLQQEQSVEPHFYSNANAFSSVPDLPVHIAQPSGNYSGHLYDRAKPSQSYEYSCPQSAPPTKTTFGFSEPSPNPSEATIRHGWVPSQPHTPEYHALTPNAHRGEASMSNAFSTGPYQPPFAPKTHFGILPANSRLGSSSEHLMNFASLGTPPATEFKTERETKPNQIFIKTTTKDFNFSNSTVKDFRASNGRKK